MDTEELRKHYNCPDLYRLTVAGTPDGLCLRKCACRMSGDCSGPVKYQMIVEVMDGPDRFTLDTYFYCEHHK